MNNYSNLKRKEVKRYPFPPKAEVARSNRAGCAKLTPLKSLSKLTNSVFDALFNTVLKSTKQFVNIPIKWGESGGWILIASIYVFN